MSQESPEATSRAGRLVARIKHVIHRPDIQILFGACIVTSALFDIIRSMLEDAHKIGAHHGVLVIGVGQLFTALSDLREGMKKTLEGVEEEREHNKQLAKEAAPAGAADIPAPATAVATETPPIPLPAPVRAAEPALPAPVGEVAQRSSELLAMAPAIAPAGALGAAEPALPAVEVGPKHLVLTLTGLPEGGLNGEGALVPRLRAVRGVSRVDVRMADGVTIRLTTRSAPDPELLRAVATTLRAAGPGSVNRSAEPSGSRAGSVRRGSPVSASP
jgi:hypothetical protein